MQWQMSLEFGDQGFFGTQKGNCDSHAKCTRITFPYLEIMLRFLEDKKDKETYCFST
jgi:hypothetical protein